MAGNYPDAPAPRMYYDRDGTIGFWMGTDGVVSQFSQVELEQMNDEDLGQTTISGTSFDSPGYFRAGFIFPELRDLSGYFFSVNGFGPQDLQWSDDTTNGIDGTWTTITASPTESDTIIPNYRTINSLSVTNALAIRWRHYRTSGSGSFSAGFRAVHLYGSIVAGATPDRIRFWHPTLDEPLDDPTSADGAYFDWGNVPRSTMADRTFRLKNNSATLTANDIDLTTQTLTDTTPSLNGQFTYSDGGAFASSLNFTSLAPGALTPVITVRRTTPSNATLSVWTTRINIDVDNWS